MAAYKARLKQFEDALSAEVVDLKRLRKLCFHDDHFTKCLNLLMNTTSFQELIQRAGCPFESGFRSLSWKLLLNYLPRKRSEWKLYKAKQRTLYAQFVHELIIKPGSTVNYKYKDCADVTVEDHPLNPHPDSEWHAFFKDNEMLVQIDKDCRRLCPDLFFFQKATEHPCEKMVNNNSNVETLRKRVEQSVLQSETVSRNRLGITNMIPSRKKASEQYHVLSEGEEAHWEVVERILFIYAKLNPGLAYVQGMNEILGPIYYTFSSDPDKECQEYAEADAFFCFTNIMSEIRDNFIKTLDDSDCGIGNMMKQLMKMLKEKDPAVKRKLDEQELKPQYYSFRWLTLLLSQEFPLPDVLRLWDTLFSDENRFQFLITLCCAMLMLLRNELLQEDFPTCMKLLQKLVNFENRKECVLTLSSPYKLHRFYQNFPYSRVDVSAIISKALDLCDRCS